MDNQQPSTKQIMLNYGLMLAFVSILMAVANFAFGDVYKPHWSIQVINAIITIVFIVLGLKKVKESNNGLLSLGEALKTGLGISLISGLIFIVYFYAFTNFIEPEFFANSVKVQELTLIEGNPNLSDEQLEQSIEMMKKFSGFGMASAFIMIFSLFFGFIISLIAGLIMKKTEEVD